MVNKIYIICKYVGWFAQFWFAQLLVQKVAAVKRFHFKFCQAVKIFVSENNIINIHPACILINKVDVEAVSGVGR